LRRGATGLAEAYMEGHWSTPDLTRLLLVLEHNLAAMGRGLPKTKLFRLNDRLGHRRNRNSRKGSRRNISFHYDLGNDFYELWLDPSMTYSSALFEHAGQNLEAAQEAKYRRLAQDVGIQPGDHVLEIGCGWGGFAEFAVREYGCRVTGLTLSREQLAYAQDRLEKAGLADRAEFLLCDYRDVEGRFDHIVSIEMLEAVGEEYWPTYFERLQALLKPGGKAGVQVITIEDHRFDRYRRGADFIQKYIFPGGMLPCPSVLHQQVEAAGLQFTGSHEFGESYSQTLRRWHETFNERWDDVAAQGFDERFRRMWNFYLTSCAASFHSGNTDVTQISVTRPG
jgi:cyclopropane-fatty-acyl-phospholipid synthase